MSSVSISFDDAVLTVQLDALEKKLQAAARPAAQAAAQVLYDEVRLNSTRGGEFPHMSKKPHGYKGNPTAFSPGNLKAAIYQVYSKTNSVDGKQTYQISYNHKKAFYGRFLEFGTVKMAAKPFIRPAYDTKKAAALQASKAKFLELAKEAINGA